MEVLVTGGAGFIGSHVVRQLVEAGHHVTVLDNLVKGHRISVHPDAKFVLGDCGDRNVLSSLFGAHSFEVVMHFAAFIEAGESMKVPERFYANNTASTLVLLEAMLESGVRKFIFSSTAATYGAPKYIPMDELHPQEPTNEYGFSKVMVEMVLEKLHQQRGLAYAALRYFNASGCSEALGEDHHPETHLIPLALDVALGKREHIRLFGTDYPTPDGTCIRDYVHVEDLAAAHLAAAKMLGARPRMIYNLGNGEGFSVRQVIDSVRRVTGHPIPVVEDVRRPGDPPVLVATSLKIQEELGWKPKYAELDSIVQSAWDWRRRYPLGYEPSRDPFGRC